MKCTSLLVAAAVVVPAVAVADPGVNYDDARLAGQTLVKVLDAGKASSLRGAFTPGMTIENLQFADAACDKTFGQRKARTIAKKQFARFATCLLRADWRPSGDVEIHAGDDGFVVFGDDLAAGPYLVVVFGPSKDGVPRITKIEAHWSDEPVPDAPEGDVNGEVGGVMGDVPPPAPPPPAPGQAVAPTALEALRIKGAKEIVPGAATKKAIARSGKDKVVASFKLCVDSTGAVDRVVLIKSSGFKDYDAKLDAGIHTWAYQPYLIDGAAQPVCTAVTFVYSQK